MITPLSKRGTSTTLAGTAAPLVLAYEWALAATDISAAVGKMKVNNDDLISVTELHVCATDIEGNAVGDQFDDPLFTRARVRLQLTPGKYVDYFVNAEPAPALTGNTWVVSVSCMTLSASLVAVAAGSRVSMSVDLGAVIHDGDVNASALYAGDGNEGDVLIADGATGCGWGRIVASMLDAEASTEGQVLTSDGAGGATWADSAGDSQTPWTSNIDADGFDLNDLGDIRMDGILYQMDGATPRKAYDPQLGFIYASDESDSIDAWGRRLFDPSEAVSLEWDSRQLYATYFGSGSMSIDYQNRELWAHHATHGNRKVMDYNLCELYELSGDSARSANWSTRRLYGTDGATVVVDWELGGLYNGGVSPTVNWLDRILYDEFDDTNALDWGQRFAYDESGALSINWAARVLKGTDGSTTTVDYGNFTLFDGGFSESVMWGTHELMYSDGSIATVNYGTCNLYGTDGLGGTELKMSWDYQGCGIVLPMGIADTGTMPVLNSEDRVLYDVLGGVAIDFDFRELKNSSDSSVLQWGSADSIILPGLPTVDPSNAGQLWNDGGTVKVSAGGA